MAADKWEKIGIKTKDGTVNGIAPVIVFDDPERIRDARYIGDLHLEKTTFYCLEGGLNNKSIKLIWRRSETA